MATAAITADIERQYQDGDLLSYPVDASAGRIPKGALVEVDATGQAINAADGANDEFGGVAYEGRTAGATDGAVRIKCMRRGLHRFHIATVEYTNQGEEVYVSNNNEVTLSAGNNKCGRIIAVETTSTDGVVIIDIEGYC